MGARAGISRRVADKRFELDSRRGRERAALRRAERKRVRLGQHEEDKILRLPRMRRGIHGHGKRGIFMLRQKARTAESAEIGQRTHIKH